MRSPSPKNPHLSFGRKESEKMGKERQKSGQKTHGNKIPLLYFLLFKTDEQTTRLTIFVWMLLYKA